MKEDSILGQQFYISGLISAELRGELSVEQRAELNEWLAAAEVNRIFYNRLTTESYFQAEMAAFMATDSEALRLKIKGKISADTIGVKEGNEATRPFYQLLYFRIAAAAAVAALAFGVWFYYIPRYVDHEVALKQNSSASTNYANDVKPGKNTATLTLANGKTINLSDAKTGVIIDASKLTYNDGSAIAKQSNLDAPAKTASRNDGKVRTLTVATPRGGQYQIVLPDGSKVWLNAASSLQFPESFAGRKQRSIVLEGEAYFEIYKDREHPFIVESGGQQVEVLGTHFNVSAYADEGNVKTTLLEGSVKVAQSRKGGSVVLKPNEQATLTGDRLQVEAVVAEDEVAWKEGFFLFKRESLETVMYKISRWYNVEVVYDDPSLKKETILGTMSRYEQLSKVLNLLKRTGVATFDINGKEIHVKKQIGN